MINLNRFWPWSVIARLTRERDIFDQKLCGLLDSLKKEGRHTIVEGMGATITQAHISGGDLIVLGDNSAVISCYVEKGKP